jgi:outer membrane protein assembly factor BamA
MLALIIGFLSFVSPANGSEKNHDVIIVSDSVKRPLKKRTHAEDTTGVFLNINRIFIIGNRITRDQIILRELTLKAGDVIYSTEVPGILDLDRKKLINTRLFNTVAIRVLELDSTNVDLLVDLNERWYTFPAPIFELADRNFNEWWQNYNHDFRRVNYGLRLYQYNMRGRNETLRFHAQIGFQRKFELHYRFPYIDKRQKHGLSTEFTYQETKNLAIRTDDHKYTFLKFNDLLRTDKVAALTYTYRKSFYKTHSVKYEFRRTEIADTVKALNPNYIKGETRKELRYNYITYQFNADHRDFIAYPLKGFHLQANFTRTGLIASDDVKKWEGHFTYSNYLELGKKFFLSNNATVYASTPNDLSYVNYGVLGLRRQFVRGYEVYVIEGQHFFLNKTTFKKLIFSNTYHWGLMPIEQFRHIPLAIYLKTYFDIGAVENYPDYEAANINTRLSDKLLSGAGFGVDVVGSYDIVLRFEYTFNAEGERGFFFHLRREF